MTIKEVEERTDMVRANIRFYEEEGLLCPSRSANGYRDYSENDLETLKRIRLLRTLHMSLEEIKALHTGEQELAAALERHLPKLEQQQVELKNACDILISMKNDGAVYQTLDAQHYLTALEQRASETAPNQKNAQTAPELISDRMPRVKAPWRRFWARTLDYAIYSLLWDLFLILAVHLNISNVTGVTMLSHLLALVLMLFLEPAMLARFGSTPGKWLMGFTVLHYEERRMTYSEAMERTWGVLFRGMGLGVPFANLFCGWKSYLACMDGDTLRWECDSVLHAKDDKNWRIFAWILAQGAVFLVLLAALFHAGQPGYKGDLTVRQFCENYNRLAAYYDMENGSRLGENGKWVKEETGGYVIEVDWGLPLPEFHFAERNGIMTGMSFTVFAENCTVVTGCQREMLLCAMSFAGAQKGDSGLKEIISYIQEHPFEDFAFTANGVKMTCRVEYSGYLETSALETYCLYAKEGSETTFFLQFEMEREPW